jgi:flagellar hook-basal body complex protein FliE
MTVVPLAGLGADAPLARPPAPDAGSFAGSVLRAFEGAGSALSRADASERAFAAGHGGLAEMVIERARADVALAIAGAAASRITQGLNTLLGMQI